MNSVDNKSDSLDKGLIPARMLNEFVYCPRLCYIEWIQGEFEESVDTVEGRYTHRRVDLPAGKMADESDEGIPNTIRSLHLSAAGIGITCKIDLVEKSGETVIPVDYKKGKSPDVEKGAWDADRIQLCAQAMVLRESGYKCHEGLIYYAGSKKRVKIPIDQHLVDQTTGYVDSMRSMARKNEMPLPLVDSPKCPKCSLVGVCLPDEINFLRDEEKDKKSPRRLIPPIDKGNPVYVVGQGHTIRKKGDELIIYKRKEKVANARIREISNLSLFGGVEITTPAMRELLQKGIPICFFSHGGWFYGIAKGHHHKNVELRMLQYQTATTRSKCLDLAKHFIHGKIRNCRTILRRNDRSVPKEILIRLSNLADQALTAESIESLLGIEGAAAQQFFSRFNHLVKSESLEFNFEHRNKRPPKDPVNAVLSYVYGILTKELFVALLSVGFDPYLGFLHKPRYGRPALALDLMEEFRPIIADSVTITLFNTNELQVKDFIITGAGVTITSEGRKKVLRAYERRMSDEIKHPLFGYTISYRRVLNVQARLLSRVLSNEVPVYAPFLTR